MHAFFAPVCAACYLACAHVCQPLGLLAARNPDSSCARVRAVSLLDIHAGFCSSLRAVSLLDIHAGFCSSLPIILTPWWWDNHCVSCLETWTADGYRHGCEAGRC